VVVRLESLERLSVEAVGGGSPGGSSGEAVGGGGQRARVVVIRLVVSFQVAVGELPECYCQILSNRVVVDSAQARICY
jgi:hypothetical protein